MRHCNDCNIDVNTPLNYCPLCFKQLEDDDKKGGQSLYSVAQEKPKTIIKNYFVIKLMFLLSLLASGVCLFINLFLGGKLWSVLVIICICYIWILTKHTILSNRSVFEKVFLQIVGIFGILLYSYLTFGEGVWFWDYVLPGLIITIILALDIVLLSSPRRKNYELSFAIIHIILLAVPIVFLCVKVCEVKLIHWVSLFLLVLSFMGMILFDGKYLRQEFLKKFHL